MPLCRNVCPSRVVWEQTQLGVEGGKQLPLLALNCLPHSVMWCRRWGDELVLWMHMGTASHSFSQLMSEQHCENIHRVRVHIEYTTRNPKYCQGKTPVFFFWPLIWILKYLYLRTEATGSCWSLFICVHAFPKQINQSDYIYWTAYSVSSSSFYIHFLFYWILLFVLVYFFE